MGSPYPGGIAWTGDNAATKQYDSYKVQAIINEINGFDHSGRYSVGVPAIFGMNFQTVSIAEKLLTSPATLIGPDAKGNYTLGPQMLGGYYPGTTTPGPLLQSALDYVNAQLERMVDADPAAGPDRLDGDHRDRQARPVATESESAAPDRRWRDHHRDQQRVGSEDRLYVELQAADRRRNRR